MSATAAVGTVARPRRSGPLGPVSRQPVPATACGAPAPGRAEAPATPGRTLLAVVLLVAAVAVGGLALRSVPALRGPAPSPAHSVTVQSGQTLSEVAEVNLPHLPIAEGVTRIQLANRLNSAHVHAGQTLRIPAVG